MSSFCATSFSNISLATSMIGGTDLKLVRTVEFLSHFWPMFPFFASLTNQKIYGFLAFSEDIRGYFLMFSGGPERRSAYISLKWIELRGCLTHSSVFSNEGFLPYATWVDIHLKLSCNIWQRINPLMYVNPSNFPC